MTLFQTGDRVSVEPARAAVWLLLFSLLVAATPAAAQTAGTLVGTVAQPGAGPLPGTSVTARQAETGFTRTATTDASGRYALPALPAGTYEVRAEIAGFKPLIRRNVVLTVSETRAVDFSLAPGDLAVSDAVVEVEAKAPLVNTESPELSYLVSGKALETLPLNGRNYTDLALLQPGVVAFPHRDGGSVVAHGLGMSVNGQDPRSNVYLLDGTLQNDFTNGPAGSAAGTALGLEGVREFRVETNAYGAEFGRNAGGQVTVVTRSGTNNLGGQRLRIPSERGARRAQLLRRRRKACLHAEPVRRQPRRSAAGEFALLLRHL